MVNIVARNIYPYMEYSHPSKLYLTGANATATSSQVPSTAKHTMYDASWTANRFPTALANERVLRLAPK